MSPSPQSTSRDTQDPSRSLISPPPEETLRRNPFTNTTTTALAGPKRKRSNAPTAPRPDLIERTDSTTSTHSIDVTPNPKPRKQSRKSAIAASLESPTRSTSSSARRLSSLQPHESPHAKNPNADFLLPTSVRTRRSRTPMDIPPYEPPTERFTPPREITISPPPRPQPRVRKTTTREGSTGAKKKTLKVVVKRELPDIDLTLPLPPPSPTDDPLLLSGTRRQRKPKKVLPISESGFHSVQTRLAAEAPSPPSTTSAGSSSPPSVGQHPSSSGSSRSNHPVSRWGPTAEAPFDSSSPVTSPDAPKLPWGPQEEVFTSSPTKSIETSLPSFEEALSRTINNVSREVEDQWSASDSEDDEFSEEGDYTGKFNTSFVPTKEDPPTITTKRRMERWGRPISPFPLAARRLSRTIETDEEDMEVDEEEEISRSHPDHPAFAQLSEEESEWDDSEGDLRQEDVDVSLNDAHESFDPTPLDESQDMAEDDILFDLDADLSQQSLQRSSHQTVEEDEEDEDFIDRELSLAPSDPPEEETDETVRMPLKVSHDILPQEIASHPSSPFNHRSPPHDEQDSMDQDASTSVPPPVVIQPPSSPPPTSQSPTHPTDTLLPASQEPATPRRTSSLLSQRMRARQSGAGMGGRFSPFSFARQHSKSQSPAPSDVPTEIVSSPEESGEPEAEEDMSPPPARNELRRVSIGKGGEVEVEEDEDDDGLSASGSDSDASMIKITSDDPRAAARAAAILKQHDYECYTRIALKKQQLQRHSSLSSISSLSKNSRRRGVSEFGIRKTKSTSHAGSSPNVPRRKSMGSVVGDRVYFPGSPVTTLPELLKEAEADLSQTHPHPTMSDLFNIVGRNASSSRFSTPESKPASLFRPSDFSGSLIPGEDKKRGVGVEWTKDDWKLLDACFTDERIAVGIRIGLVEGEVASVDSVDLEDVVNRFAEIAGLNLTDSVVQGDPIWGLDGLLKRARALQRKQRLGNLGTPTGRVSVTPSISTASHSPSASRSSIKVPDFTPWGARLNLRRPVLPPPVVDDAPFKDAGNTSTGSAGSGGRVAPLLLAPRYSHLLHEARSISGSPQPPGSSSSSSALDPPQSPSGSEGAYEDEDEEEEVERQSLMGDFDRDFDEDDDDGVYHDHGYEDEEVDVSFSPSTSASGSGSGSNINTSTPNGLGGRMKGFLMSYLPLSTKTPTTSRLPKPPTSTSARPGLPLPPSDILTKPRGPVHTPARPAPPKTPAPKDLVHLNTITPVADQKKSALPRPVGRLVKLNHVPPKPEPEYVPVQRPRRSSGASVKDLVNSFESMEKQSSSTYPKSGSLKELKRVRSTGEGGKGGKPAWR